MLFASLASWKRRVLLLAAISALRAAAITEGRADTAEEGGSKSKSDHWAFKPAVRQAIPKVSNPGWVQNPIDAFVLARLEAEKLAPAEEADRVTLIRRLSFDLTGLPPTPEEVERFAADVGSDAYEKLVDRLLHSPRYGERWARHWLDVVHYGESHGYDKDKPRLNAWPYRDYVIRSFNGDKPYSRFVQEQLAGDALFSGSADGVVALGFIAAGPWDFVGHVELPESKTDGIIARYNDRDDMVMNAMSTFQSLTVHCARCHDHKFDPISQEEYYRLQAVFAGVDRAEQPFDTDTKVVARRKLLMLEKKHLEDRQKELNEVVAKVTNPHIERIDSRLKELEQHLQALPRPEKGSPGNGYHSGIEPKMDAIKWVQVDLGRTTPIDEVRLIPARPTDFPDTPGFGFPRRFLIEASDDQKFDRRMALVDETGADYANPGDNPVAVRVQDARARFVRVTAIRLWERTQDYVFALGELQVLSGTNNVALGAKVTALDSIDAGRWSKQYLVDNFDSRKSLVQPTEPFEVTAKRQSLEAEIKTKNDEREASVRSLLEPKTRAALAEVSVRLEELRREMDALPRPQKVYGATSDFKSEGSFVPSNGPRPIHMLKRGDVKRPGALMDPGTLSCVPGLNSHFEITDPNDEGLRRVALAAWITDPRNMLTRRSIVNRVWQYHFGRGIVDTPNDFGHMGSLPTHPELLDWLAYWFLDHGESLKKLNRLIVTSATYRQKSGNNPAFARLDNDNRYLWRMNRQRLDAESFHDTLLFLSGRLDLTMGGSSVQQFFFKDDHSPTYDYTRFDVDSPASARRSVYRFIVRSVPDPFMECLDGADPSLLTAKRNVTLTALQALSTLNNPFVLRQCEHFAARLQQRNPELPKQIEQAYRLALSRPPRPDEAQLLRAYSRKHGLANACRVLLNSSEFVFVD